MPISKKSKKPKLYREDSISTDEWLAGMRKIDRASQDERRRSSLYDINRPIGDRDRNTDRDIALDEGRADLRRAMRAVQNRGVRRLRRR